MEEINLQTEKYKVLVRCMTYNHSNFIEEALNGFITQETTFPYVCIIMDDASKDGEQKVLEKWMKMECLMEDAKYIETDQSNIVIVPHKSNRLCTMAFYFLKKNLFYGDKRPFFEPWRQHCEYEALCEGDDYWTDIHKLQRQVDFMDKYPMYSMLAENALVLNEMNKSKYLFSKDESRDIKSMEEMIYMRRFPTAGVLMRMDYVKEMYKQTIYPHDTYIWCWMFSKGKIRYNDIVSSVYRRGLQGVCESTEHFLFGKQIEKWDLNLAEQFGLRKKFIYFTIANTYRYTCNRAIQYKQYKSAYKSGLKMLLYCMKYLIAFN